MKGTSIKRQQKRPFFYYKNFFSVPVALLTKNDNKPKCGFLLGDTHWAVKGELHKKSPIERKKTHCEHRTDRKLTMNHTAIIRKEFNCSS